MNECYVMLLNVCLFLSTSQTKTDGILKYACNFLIFIIYFHSINIKCNGRMRSKLRGKNLKRYDKCNTLYTREKSDLQLLIAGLLIYEKETVSYDFFLVQSTINVNKILRMNNIITSLFCCPHNCLPTTRNVGKQLRSTHTQLGSSKYYKIPIILSTYAQVKLIT